MPTVTDQGGGGSIGGAILSSIPVLGSIYSNYQAGQDASANRDFAADQANLAYERNMEMWDKTNAYNAPKAIMSRYIDAGLNPNLIYGSATGNVAQLPHAATPASAPAAPQRPDLGAAASRSISAYQDLRSLPTNLANTQAQTQNTIATMTSTMMATFLKALGFGNAQDNLEADTALKQHQASAQDAAARRDDMEAMTGFSRNEREALSNSQSIKEAIARIAYMRIQGASLAGKTAAEIENLKANTAKVLNDKSIGDMDIKMRENGVMPHDNPFYRAVSGGLNSIFGGSPTAAGGDGDSSSPTFQGRNGYDLHPAKGTAFDVNPILQFFNRK